MEYYVEHFVYEIRLLLKIIRVRQRRVRKCY